MTDTTTSPVRAPLSGQDINLAASATRQLLIAMLRPLDIAFEQWTVINQVGSGRDHGRARRAGPTRRRPAALRCRGRRILAGSPWVARDECGPADADRSRSNGLRPRVGDRSRTSSPTCYAGFSPEDLARTANRVEVTAKATARLAAAA